MQSDGSESSEALEHCSHLIALAFDFLKELFLALLYISYILKQSDVIVQEEDRREDLHHQIQSHQTQTNQFQIEQSLPHETVVNHLP